MIKHNFQALKYLMGAGFIHHDFNLIISSPDSFFTKRDIEQITILISEIMGSAIENDYIFGVIGQCLPVFEYFLKR